MYFELFGEQLDDHNILVVPNFDLTKLIQKKDETETRINREHVSNCMSAIVHTGER